MKLRLPKYSVPALVAIALLVISVSFYNNRSYVQPQPMPNEGQEAAPHLSTLAGLDRSKPAVTTTVKGKTDYRRQFDSASNLWDFAHASLDAARNNDADAQYYLSKALKHCIDFNKMYFTRFGSYLSLTEGLAWAAERHLSAENVQAGYSRCHVFMDHAYSELGEASDWQARATVLGQPVAQAQTAIDVLISRLLSNSARAAGVPNPNDGQSQNAEVDPRELLLAAVKSLDPGVLFSMGDAQGLLNPDDPDKEVDRLAWFFLACEHGFDCSSHSDWVIAGCAYTAECALAADQKGAIQHLAGEEFPIIERRAAEIAANLDAGNWDALFKLPEH